MIRKVGREDLQHFVDVYIQAYRGLEEYAYTRRRDVKDYFRWLMNRDSEGFMVAEIEGRPVGFVACDANWISIFERRKVGEIHELFVLPEYRGRGIGSKLLAAAMDYARSRGRDLAELWVGRTNYRARRFYEKRGFVEKGEWGRWIRMVREI